MVTDVVERLFEGMRTGDSAVVRSVFTQDANMYTATLNDVNKPVLHKGNIKEFINAIGSPHDQVLDEPIWNIKVEVDGLLAQVWTDYAFYLGGQFMHCGVDAFQLFKTDEGWKIFHVTDTRRKTNCNIPEEIKNQRK